MRKLVSETPFHPTLPTTYAAAFWHSSIHWNLPRQIYLLYSYSAILMLLKVSYSSNPKQSWKKYLSSCKCPGFLSCFYTDFIVVSWNSSCMIASDQEKKKGQPSSKSEAGNAFGFGVRSMLAASFFELHAFVVEKDFLGKKSSEIGRWDHHPLTSPTVDSNPFSFLKFN